MGVPDSYLESALAHFGVEPSSASHVIMAEAKALLNQSSTNRIFFPSFEPVPGQTEAPISEEISLLLKVALLARALWESDQEIISDMNRAKI